MNTSIYPGCTPEFRILERQDGSQVLQVRQVNPTYEYTSKWEDVPIVKQQNYNITKQA